MFAGLHNHAPLLTMAKVTSRENKLPPKKFRENVLLLFTLLNFSEIGCKQCNENDVPYFLYNSYGNAIESLLSLSKFVFVETTLCVNLPSIDSIAVLIIPAYPL